VIEPRQGAGERFREPYVRLLDELERRGWLERSVAEHARARAAAHCPGHGRKSSTSKP
jgi:hypothetical protein